MVRPGRTLRMFIATTITIEPPKLLMQIGESLRDMRQLCEQVGVQLMSHAGERLTSVLKQGDAVRSGLLSASLNVGTGGGGTGDTVFEISDLKAVVGSNLRYAAQVHYGGTIVPVNAKALAIPLNDRLQRGGIGPRELDPTGEKLTFLPAKGGKPNATGVLIDDTGELGYGKEPLYALRTSVPQPARPYLLVDEEDERVIAEEILPEHLGRQKA